MSRLLDLTDFVGEKLRWHEQVLHDVTLSATTRMIASKLMHDLNVRKKGAWRSQPEIARDLGINIKTVRRGVAELVQAGHITTTPSRGRGNAILYEALLRASEDEKPDNLPALSDAKRPDGKADKLSGVQTESRTKEACKEASGAPPYLYESISSPSFPRPKAGGEARGSGQDEGERRSSLDEASSVGLASELVAVPFEIREKLSAHPQCGEGFCASYIDHSWFNPSTGELHARSTFARGEIRKRLGDAGLRALGLNLGQPVGASGQGGEG